MAYTKQNFEDGMLLKAEHLNHIEDGIVNTMSILQDVDERVTGDINDLKQEDDLLSKGYIRPSFEFIHGDVTNGVLDTNTKHTIVTRNVETFDLVTYIRLDEAFVMSVYRYNGDTYTSDAAHDVKEYTFIPEQGYRISVRRDDHDFDYSEIADIKEFSRAIKIKTLLLDHIENVNELVNDLNTDFGDLNKRVTNDINNLKSGKQDKLVNNTDYEVVPLITRNSSTITYQTISQGASEYGIPQRTLKGALRTNFDKDFNGMFTQAEKDQQVVNYGYLNERLQGLGGGGKIYRHWITVTRGHNGSTVLDNYGFVNFLVYLSNATPINTYEQLSSLNTQLGGSLTANLCWGYSELYLTDSPDGLVLPYRVSLGSSALNLDYIAAYPANGNQAGSVSWSDFDNITITDNVTEV